ncbi:MAG: gene transfer agent family protein [Rhizobiales bacterium]|nr:gene transfer agent family protein [Hyphomicrobiales bacterium]
MANARRGEISAVLGGRERRLVLTLGALAELESGLGATDLSALAERLAGGRLAARDAISIIGAGLRGAGEEISDGDVARLDCPDGVAGYVAIVARLLAGAFPSGSNS